MSMLRHIAGTLNAEPYLLFQDSLEERQREKEEEEEGCNGGIEFQNLHIFD